MAEKNKKSLKGEGLSLEDLINIQEWQKVQDNFSAITEVGLRLVDSAGNAITSPSKEPRLCSKLLKDSVFKAKICGPCLPTFLGGEAVVDKNLSFTCEVGLCNFVSPLRIKERVFGYIIVGPVILVMRKSKEEYRKIAEELSLDLDDFWSGILEIKVISFQGMQSMVEFIKDVAEYNLRLSYQNIIRRKEMALDSFRLSRLLDALLDVAFQVTGADKGSIMLLDRKKDELTIQTSRGIANEIVRNTRVKFGEGISGTAAKEGQSFVVDDNITDNRIRRYMGQPYLNSSMVIPIKVKDRTWGVMNLGALNTSTVRFDTNNIQLINKLIDLATIALYE